MFGVYRRPFVGLSVTEMVARTAEGKVVAQVFVAPKDEEAMQQRLESFLAERYGTRPSLSVLFN